MKRLLQINITANWGSHGRIAEGIGLKAMERGWESYVAYGRWLNPSKSTLYHIGNNFDEALHIAGTRLFDVHGLMSHVPSLSLISYIKRLQPTVIHLHNVHGYYLNYPLLFNYLRSCGVPVVWTLHDCWSFTGHCANFMYAGCEKWRTHCHDCELKKSYPKSLLADRSRRNYDSKRRWFTSLDNLMLVTVSRWLDERVAQSYLKDVRRVQMYSGIDTSLFNISPSAEAVRARYAIPEGNKIVLGVASNWFHKGLPDFIKLRNMLGNDYTIVLVGLNKSELETIPESITGISRTDNQAELAALYSAADVFFNPTWEDNFPTTNLEALACGTPVVTYNTGGSPEAIDSNTGFTIAQGDLAATKDRIALICNRGKTSWQPACRHRALSLFNQEKRLNDYVNLYESLL